MKLALLGVDAESLRLAEAAVSAGHSIVWPADLAGAEPPPQLDSWRHPLLATDSWEELLDSQTADAIIVGRGAADDELRGRQVQELVKLERPMLVTFPVFDSVLTYFEVDMARTESDAVLQHFNPLVEAPRLEETANWVEHGHPELGAVEQVVCMRWFTDRTRERVLWHFARDVELLGRVAGRLNRIGAHASGGADAAAYAALSVQLLGTLEKPVRWTVEPPTGTEGMNLTLVCERGRVTLAFDASDLSMQVMPRDQEPAASTQHSHPTPQAIAIGRFTAAVEAKTPPASTWPDALHAMELTDSIEISLRRGRMIDVHHQQLTEHLAFKGTMAAAGCGVLLVVMPLMLLIGWIAGQFGIPVAQYWPHVLLAMLALFLALQFLPKLLYPAPSKE